MINKFGQTFVKIQGTNQSYAGCALRFDDKYIVTCTHVLRDAYQKELSKGIDFNAKMPFISCNGMSLKLIKHFAPDENADFDTHEDLALLKWVNRDACRCKSLEKPCVASGHVREKDKVKLYSTANRLHIEAICRQQTEQGWLQLDIVGNREVRPGDSGSPVWSDRLEAVIGILVARYPRIGVCYIIPVAKIKEAFKDYLPSPKPKENVGGNGPKNPEPPKSSQLQEDAKKVFGLIKDGKWTLTSMKQIATDKFDGWQYYKNKNLPEANWLIGLCYRMGVNVPRDMKRALELYVKATEGGCFYAAICLDYDHQIADCIYKASNGGTSIFSAMDVWNKWQTNCPLPPLSYSLIKLREKMRRRAASKHFYETTSAVRFKVEFSSDDYLLRECRIILSGEHKMGLDTYRSFFDEFCKWRSQDAGVGLDYTVLIDASGSMLSETALCLDNLSSDAWAKEQIYDFQHQCADIDDRPRKIDLAKFAAWILIDRIHEESREDTCMVGSFGKQLDVHKRQISKVLLKKDVCSIRVPEGLSPPTRLWASIGDILQDMSNAKVSSLRFKHAIVFTDGWDNYSGDTDPSEVDRINKDDRYRDKRNIEFAQQFVLNFYRQMKDDGVENPPRLRIVAIDPSGKLRSLWDAIQKACNVDIYPFPVVHIETYSGMDSVIKAFMNEAQRLKVRLARVGTIENFVWIFLGKEAPKPRFFVYPGAVIATLVAMGKISESKIGLQKLRQLIHEFIQSTCREEIFQPIGPHLIDTAQVDLINYLDFLAKPQIVDVLTEAIVECALKGGWIKMDESNSCMLEIKDPSPASVLLNQFFLTGDWKDGRAKLQDSIMPRIKKMCKENDIGFPLITVNELRSHLD